MKIGLIGPETQVQHIEKLFKKMNIDYKNLNSIFDKNSYISNYLDFIRELRTMDIIYTIGIAFRVNPKIIISSICGKKVINHWIGSDILVARENKTNWVNQKFINKNLSCSSLISEELSEIGIESEIVPIIPSGLSYKVASMPKEHAVLVYLPEGNEDFYGKRYVELLAERYSQIRFNIVANSNSELVKFKNVKLLGKLSLEEMETIYNEISILLRLPEHDGLSLMLIEALAKGKEVIYKYDFPYTYLASDSVELLETFEQILSKEPTINHEANRFIVNNYSDEKIIAMYKDIINRI